MRMALRSAPAARLVVIVVLGVVALVAVRLFLGAERSEARERWDEREPAAYTYVYGHCSGMCASCPVQITVRDGEVTGATVDDPGCSAPELDFAPTVEDLFAIAGDHQPWPFSDRTEIDYDPFWGFPRYISTTCGEDTSDCGEGWSAHDFEALS